MSLIAPDDAVARLGIRQELDRLRARRDGLVKYLQLKIDDADWHAVQDSASDIRDINAKIEALRGLIDA